MWEHLPDHLREPLTMNNSTTLQWGTGRLQVLPSTERAGRSGTNTVFIMDEADRHPYLEAAYTSARPTVADVKSGKLILMSTRNWERQDSFFLKLFREAPSNGFCRQFVGWQARPGRSQAWYDNEARGYPDRYVFQAEYPGSIEEALAVPSSLAAFDPAVLETHLGQCASPVDTLGAASIFVKPLLGHRYCAFTDTSHGVGKDYGVTVVLDATVNRFVADVVSNTLTPEELADQSIGLLQRYGYPTWGIEDNDWGRSCIKRAEMRNYPRLYQEDGANNPGWRTGRNRSEMWSQLVEAHNQQLVFFSNAIGLKQFADVIRNPDKKGRIEAISGGHDDYPLACAGAWQVKEQATRLHGENRRRLAPMGAGGYNW
jgi:hypothetical protein